MPKFTPQEIKYRAHARALVRTEERLLELRFELDALAAAIDRITIAPRRPQIMAGDMPAVGNVFPFARQGRPNS
jgi:hypothetical protein